MTLKLGKGITFPNEAITETFGILAARGAGKSNTAAVMAEEMFAADLPFVVIDPVGSWWGLRSSQTGKGPGLDVPLFGGKRGDVPLERTGGRLVADLVVDERLSCIIDLTEFESEGAKRQFLVDFARRLYKRNEMPLHLFLEEADDYIPQTVPKAEPGEAAALPGMLLRAWENIVRRGRARGLGMTMITQRSASINKNVLTQAQTLIAMRTTGPQDVKAIEQWVKYNAQSVDILKTLPELADGEAWIWSPQFLKKTERVKFRRRRTFDSGSTPKMAAKSKTARLADVDVSQLRERMADTIKRAEEEDPKLLKKRVAELERELRTSVKADPDECLKLRLEIKDKAEENRKLRLRGDRLVDQLRAAEATFQQIAALLPGKIPLPDEVPLLVNTPDTPKPPPAPAKSGNGAFHAKRPTSNGTTKLGKGEAKILTAIAQHSDGVDREQLTVLTGYKRSSRDTYINRLSAAGLVDVGPPITATAEGVAALGSDFEPLPTGGELQAYWLDRLGGGERAILELLLQNYPTAVPRDEISARTDYKRSSRDTYIQRLRARKLITVSGHGVAASESLF